MVAWLIYKFFMYGWILDLTRIFRLSYYFDVYVSVWSIGNLNIDEVLMHVDKCLNKTIVQVAIQTRFATAGVF